MKADNAAKAEHEDKKVAETLPEAPCPQAAPAALPMVHGPALSGKTKTVRVPEEVDEAVLCAAIQAALRVQTVNFGSLIVSGHMPSSAAPPIGTASCKGKKAAKAIEEEEVDEGADDDDEGEEEEEDTDGEEDEEEEEEEV